MNFNIRYLLNSWKKLYFVTLNPQKNSVQVHSTLNFSIYDPIITKITWYIKMWYRLYFIYTYFIFKINRPRGTHTKALKTHAYASTNIWLLWGKIQRPLTISTVINMNKFIFDTLTNEIIEWTAYCWTRSEF